MHGICSKETRYSRFAGTNTEQDFVECPSQVLFFSSFVYLLLIYMPTFMYLLIFIYFFMYTFVLQMLENWCWQKEILTKISKHYTKGTPLPDELLSKMIAAKNANSGLLNLRQVFFGYFDQTIHTSEKGINYESFVCI